MMILGIDVGGSTTKIVGLNQRGDVAGMLQVEASDQVTSAFGAFGKFIAAHKLKMSDITKIVVTGVGASYITEGMYDIPTTHVDEFLAIGFGGLKLANRNSAIIVSVGTGTALVRATDAEITHLGGSGVGGGMLLNLSERFAGAHSFNSLKNLAFQGNLGKVDLRLSDITTNQIGNLPPTATVANFGNLKDDATSADIVLGLTNMIFESIGMMAIFASRNDSVKDIVLIGSLSEIEHAHKVFEMLSKLYTDLHFHIPPHAIYATALGAALSEHRKLSDVKNVS